MTFFCGGSRNFRAFIDLFDEVFVLEVDRDTVVERLSCRGDDEFGGREAELELVLRLHATGEDVPSGTVIDAIRPLVEVVDDILRRTGDHASAK